MKIKRIICLILCLVMSVFALVSCEEDIITEAQKEKDRIEQGYKPVVLEKSDVTLYIITDGDIANSTTGTVNDKIQQYLNDRTNKRFDTTLTIQYCTADEYAGKIADKESGIVLINSETMLNSLIADNKLADLNGYFVDNELIKKYGFATLNASFNKTNPLLLDVAREEGGENLYFVPNNRVMGSYEYILINRNVVCDFLNYKEDEIRASLTSEDAFNAFIAEIEPKLSTIPNASFTIDSVVKKVSGKKYEDRVSFDQDGYICTILSYPTLTRSEVAEAGFGILSGTENVHAAMEIIYLINSDVNVRNLLLYGVEDIHYDVVDGIVVPEDTERVYKMSLIYTGDIFQAYFCHDSERDVWTEEMKNNGLKQNLESKSVFN